MDLIKIIGYKIKVIIAMISAGIWIYFRTQKFWNKKVEAMGFITP